MLSAIPFERNGGDDESALRLGSGRPAEQAGTFILELQMHLVQVQHGLHSGTIFRLEGGDIHHTRKLPHGRPCWSLHRLAQFEFAVAMEKQQGFFIFVTSVFEIIHLIPALLEQRPDERRGLPCCLDELDERWEGT